jgi:uncharacterized SAM-binding protein YcdF (DUF218 family)
MTYPFDSITDFIFVETPLEPADVILIPGGSHPQVMERAATLYHEGMAPYILPSGGSNPRLHDFASEWDFLRGVGERAGVPPEAILKEDLAQNTLENAQFSMRVLEGKKIAVHKAILACKAYHSRRALLTYQAVFPPDVRFMVVPVIDRRGISRDNWFLSANSIRVVMGELERIGRYFASQVPIWVQSRHEQLAEGAIHWTNARLGQPGYAGRCYTFLEDAYELGNNIVLDGQGSTAREAAEAYFARMQAAGLRAEGPPPRGSYVFFDWTGELNGETRNWGHIALSLGDGQVIHAWDVVRIDTIQGVEDLTSSPGGNHPVYTGWAPPEIFLLGVREKAE